MSGNVFNNFSCCLEFDCNFNDGFNCLEEVSLGPYTWNVTDKPLLRKSENPENKDKGINIIYYHQFKYSSVITQTINGETIYIY